MIKNLLTDISGIELFPILALLLFFAVFVSTLVYVLKLDTGHVEAMGALPLDDDSEARNPGGSRRV